MRWQFDRWPEGLRASLPVAIPTAAVGVTFGLLAAPLLGAVASMVMSILVWSGTAQFAALSILTSGGGTATAAVTAVLANTRFLPMGFALAPSMTGGPLRRFFTGALLADASFVIGNRGSGRFDVNAVAWAAPLQYLAWVGGTVVGVTGADTIGDPERWGLDVLFPVFYLSLLLPELFPEREEHAARRDSAQGSDSGGSVGRDSSSGRVRRSVLAAVLGGAIALALTPIAPPGVPVLSAAAAALIGLWSPGRAGEHTHQEDGR